MKYYSRIWDQFYNIEILAYFAIAIVGNFFHIWILEIIGISLINIRMLSYFLFYGRLSDLINLALFSITLILTILDHFVRNQIYSMFGIIFYVIFILWFFKFSQILRNKLNLDRSLLKPFKAQ
jgi:hypothetical protein